MKVCYFLVYAGYVALVVYSWRVDANLEAMIAAASQKSSVQAAFWHQSDKSKSKPSALSASKSGLAKSVGGNASESLYTFLILNEDGEADDMSDDEPGETTINLSGGLISPVFDHDIFEDYFSSPPPVAAGGQGLSSSSSLGASAGLGTKHGGSKFDDKHQSNTVQTGASSKVSGFDGIAKSSGRGSSVDAPQRPPSNDSTATKKAISSDATSMNKERILASMYWQQLQLKRRLQRHMISSEFWDLEWYLKVLEVIDLPAVILRDITIPTTDETLWSRYYAFLQIIFAPIFILEVTGLSEDHVGALPITVFYMILSIIPAAAVYLTTHNNKPPSGTYGIVWVLFSFTMCIAWIYLLAGELVACLSAVGDALSIPSSFMGLTILAWGNSVGDFFSNIAVGKQGMSEMAVAGCYGGPIFNTFFGLGMSFLYICLKTYPEPFLLAFDSTSIISILCLLATLVATLAYVSMKDYVLESRFGYFLIMLYAVYTLFQFALLL
jgi:sodium/potassium/calcium exchanger 6